MGVIGTDIVLAIKKQSGLGVPATGAGATQIEVRPSQGLQRTVASIESGIIRRSGMKLKQRQGSITATAAYETELRIGNADDMFAGVLGCLVTAPITIDNTAVTSMTITGTGTVGTTASGSLITLGLRAGMVVKFTGLSVAGNNSVWVPVLAVTATTIAFAPGYIIDNATDSSFSMVTAKCYQTPTPRLKEYFTVEEYLSSIDRSKLGTDMRFTNLQFSAQPNAPVTVGFGLTGRNLEALVTASSPTFTSPANPAASGLLVMLDGALYRNGVAATGLTGLTMGLSGQGNITPLLTSRVGVDVGLATFGFTGSLAGLVQDLDALDASIAEDRISLFAMFSENEADPSDFVSVYAGDASYGAVNTPIADGDMIATADIYGGEDPRGGGYAATTLLISTSAA